MEEDVTQEGLVEDDEPSRCPADVFAPAAEELERNESLASECEPADEGLHESPSQLTGETDVEQLTGEWPLVFASSLRSRFALALLELTAGRNDVALGTSVPLREQSVIVWPLPSSQLEGKSAHSNGDGVPSKMTSHGPSQSMVLFTSLIRTPPKDGGESFQKPFCIFEDMLSNAPCFSVQARTRSIGIVNAAEHDGQNFVLK